MRIRPDVNGTWSNVTTNDSQQFCALLAQRLLWEVEGSLAFGEPTVDQFRNPHTLMRDFRDEIDLYNKGGQIVDFLIKWRPAPGSDLPAMMVQIAQVAAASTPVFMCIPACLG